MVRAGVGPKGGEDFGGTPFDEVVFSELGKDPGIAFDLDRRCAFVNMPGTELVRAFEACGAEEFDEVVDGGFVEVGNALGLVSDDEALDEIGILGGDSNRAMVGIAAEGLDAPQGKEKAAGGIAEVRSQSQFGGHLKTRDDAASGKDLDVFAKATADEGVVDKVEGFIERGADGIGKFERGCSGTALSSINGDVVGAKAGSDHGLADAEELGGISEAELKTHRFSSGGFAQGLDPFKQLDWCAKGRVCGGGNHVLVRWDQPDLGDLLGNLGSGKNAPVAWLGSLGEFDFDHADLFVGRTFLELLEIKAPIRLTTTKVARADLPDDVASGLEVVRAEAAFSSIVGEVSDLCAAVEGEDGVFTEGAEAHRGDVQDGCVVRFFAVFSSDTDPWVSVLGLDGSEGVIDPLVSFFIDIPLRSKGEGVGMLFGPLVDHGAHFPGKGTTIGIGFNEVLIDLRADHLEEVAKMSHQGEVLEDRVVALGDIVDPQEKEGQEYDEGPKNQRIKEGDDDHCGDDKERKSPKENAHRPVLTKENED